VTRRPGGSDGPEDVDAAFAEIVAALEREGVGAALVELEESGDPADPTPTEPGGMPVVRGPSPNPIPPNPIPPIAPNPPKPPALPGDPTERIGPIPPDEPVTPWRGASVPWDPDAADAEEHFVPPEPPPLPRLRPGTVFGLLLIAVGIFLLAAPGVVGLAPTVSTPLALISMVAGIGWLLLRMRQGPPADTDRDDGAQV
jgi:hypothetical protein